MILGYVQPSGEAPALAAAEVAGAVTALGGRALPVASEPDAGLIAVEVPRLADLVGLAARLALARRTLVEVGRGSELERSVRKEGQTARPASFRRLGSPGGPADAEVRRAGAAYVQGGGRIDLVHPKARYWLAHEDGEETVLREVAEVDRAAVASRAMPKLPFRRPVSLPPRLARAAINLGTVRPGQVVLDPFVGTGALLAEAALLGARVFGIDADPTMVRGALRNFAHLGVTAEGLVEGDARTVEFPSLPARVDVLVTDPPYGRSSASVGADPAVLVPDVLARWSARLRPGGRVVVLAPGGPATLGAPWVEELRLSVRVHRSLTREFRRYRCGA